MTSSSVTVKRSQKMVAALALGEQENNTGTRKYGTREYGVVREYDGACEYAQRVSTTEHVSTLGHVCKTERVSTLERVITTARSHPQNAVKTGHFALAAEKAPSTWIIDSGASHHMYNSHETRRALRSYDGHGAR